MQHGSHAHLETETMDTNCTFCRPDTIATYILKETPAFRIVADHAPLVEGHLLIIPKEHYACYGAVPATLDEELFELKREVRRFLDQFYAPIIFWEHGVFRQTVYHAHLHCFPFGETRYNLSSELHEVIVQSQDDIRAWYASHGHYFYLEDNNNALLFAPNMEHYIRIIQEVLWSGASSRSGNTGWRSSQQRYEEGIPLIKKLKTQWQQFQQREVNYANEAST
jgi:diadenosine tetraphosphate (Ap4A) HIT family hydrolase